MLLEMRSACCSSKNAWCRLWCSLSATPRAASPVSGSRITNSSPPSRATRSSSRTQWPMRSATSLSSRSPVSWPKVSLMGLKWSRSMKMRARGRSGACCNLSFSRCCSRRRLARPVRGSWKARRRIISSRAARSVISRVTPRMASGRARVLPCRVVTVSMATRCPSLWRSWEWMTQRVWACSPRCQAARAALISSRSCRLDSSGSSCLRDMVKSSSGS
ncbi:hypothetical protein D3C76_1159090 [compost metagenome]